MKYGFENARTKVTFHDVDNVKVPKQTTRMLLASDPKDQ